MKIRRVYRNFISYLAESKDELVFKLNGVLLVFLIAGLVVMLNSITVPAAANDDADELEQVISTSGSEDVLFANNNNNILCPDYMHINSMIDVEHVEMYLYNKAVLAAYELPMVIKDKVKFNLQFTIDNVLEDPDLVYSGFLEDILSQVTWNYLVFSINVNNISTLTYQLVSSGINDYIWKKARAPGDVVNNALFKPSNSSIIGVI